MVCTYRGKGELKKERTTLWRGNVRKRIPENG
jgi:hypothetical protein